MPVVRSLVLRSGFAAVGLILSCSDSPPASDLGDGCRQCHGSAINAAPPVDLAGRTDVSSPGVGAHQIHLQSEIYHPIGCGDCHIDPETVDAPGHIDGDNIAEVTFGAGARHRGAEPSWDRKTLTCSNTYCHGAALGDGEKRPLWTQLSGHTCGGCHELPPKSTANGFHPNDENCERCHSEVAAPNLTIANRLLHGDGVVQVEGCVGGCHGDAARNDSAPPKDIEGYLSSERVGAHQAHLNATLTTAVVCTDCHTEVKNVDSPTHIDRTTPNRAEIVFSSRARQDGLSPGYDPATATCGDTYCHGSSLADRFSASVEWNAKRGDGCDFFHQMPPQTTRSGFAHTPNDQCELCHDQTAGPGQTIKSTEHHINGILEVAGECARCHGDPDQSRIAPPFDLAGLSTSNKVGAHLIHLAPEHSAPVQCANCHVIPADDSNHPLSMDGQGPAHLTFSGLALLDTATVTYDRAAMTCGTTYCHNGAGAALAAPSWTDTFADNDCGECHGMPPPAPHPDNQSCDLCHENAGPDGSIVSADLHLNGILEANSACNTCHGDIAGNVDDPISWAPPTGVEGRDPNGVGAHQTHLHSTITPVRCESCHEVPTDLGHVDQTSPADVMILDGGSYEPSTRTCADTTCHIGPSPAWETTFADSCDGACHGAPADTPSHQPDMTTCDECHANVVGQVGSLQILDPAQHIDGLVQVDANCNACHGDAAANPNIPLSWAPPNGIDGRDPAGIGAHQSHLTSMIANVVCEDCHIVPMDLGHVDETSPADVDLLGGGTYDPSARTCANTTCHPVPSPDWTATFANTCDGACHNSPPNTPSHASSTGTDCDSCHDTTGPNLTIAIPSQHMNGQIEANEGACNACHGVAGDETDPANWWPRTDAHMAHFNSELNLTAAEWCESCHTVPAETPAPGHIADSPNDIMMDSGLGAAAGLSPSFNASTGECSNVYCHGVTVVGGDSTPAWTDTFTGCANCHGEPPSQGDHRRDPHRVACVNCHGHDGTGSNHINVSVNLQFTGQAANITATGTGDTLRCSGNCHDNHNSERW